MLQCLYSILYPSNMEISYQISLLLFLFHRKTDIPSKLNKYAIYLEGYTQTAPTVRFSSSMPIDAKMSGRIGLAAFKHSLCTLTSVSSPARVVKSMQDRARHSHAACHCFFTVLRVPKVAARLLMAGRSTLVSFIHASSKAVPGL